MTDILWPLSMQQHQQHQHQQRYLHPHPPPPQHSRPDPAPPLHHHHPSVTLHPAQVWPSPRRTSNSSPPIITPSSSVHAESRWTGRRPFRTLGSGDDASTPRPPPAASALHPPSSVMSAATPIVDDDDDDDDDDDMARLDWVRRASAAQVPHHTFGHVARPTSSLLDPALNRLELDGRRGSAPSLHHHHHHTQPTTTTTSNRGAARETTSSSDSAAAILPSLQIPASINDSKGSLAEFAAQVRRLFFGFSSPPPNLTLTVGVVLDHLSLLVRVLGAATDRRRWASHRRPLRPPTGARNLAHHRLPQMGDHHPLHHSGDPERHPLGLDVHLSTQDHQPHRPGSIR